MYTIDLLLVAATRYSARTGQRLSWVATRVVNDGKFFRNLENGADCTTRRADKIMKAILGPVIWAQTQEKIRRIVDEALDESAAGDPENRR